MNAEFWDVGATSSEWLSLTPDDVSKHLLADWMPSMPCSVSSAFLGWPEFLLEEVISGEDHFLTVSRSAGRSERQWKSILSWMLGVAGTRHFLQKERYQWIAPLSAFYPEAVQEVDISKWNPEFPRSALTAVLAQGAASPLRPDYVALREQVGPDGQIGFEWALVESKGTVYSLAGMTSCPGHWHDQARSVQLQHHGAELDVSRYIVVATRVNPNAARERTRRLQVRAWNSKETKAAGKSHREAAVEVTAAHLFGLFTNLRMRENARVMAASVQARATFRSKHRRPAARDELRRLRDAADREIESRRGEAVSMPSLTGRRAPTSVWIETDFGELLVELDSAAVTLAADLSEAEDPDEAVEKLQQGTRELDEWSRQAPRRNQRSVSLPSGVTVTAFPRRSRWQDGPS